MAIRKLFLSLEAATLESFRQTITSVRFLVAVILVGAAILLLAWAFANSALEATQAESPPSPEAIWHKGAEGALVSLAYGIVPLVIPLFPILIAYDTLERDRTTGYLEAAMSKPVPRWGIVLGKFLGIFAAIAGPAVALSLASAVVVEIIVGESVAADLIFGLAGSMLFLTACYLGLVLLVGTLLTPAAVSGLALLLWIAFNLISPTAVILGGQFLGLLSLEESQTFQIVWSDLASFTGLYQGLLAGSVPESLNFVIGSGSSNGAVPVPYWSVPLGGALWLIALLVPYTFLMTRYPLR